MLFRSRATASRSSSSTSGSSANRRSSAGQWAIAKYIEAVETEDEATRGEVMDQILAYNREGLAATWAVLQWLRSKGE